MSRRLLSRSLPLAICLSLALPVVASAAEVVLAPLVPRGATNQQVSNITSLIASELDFSSSVDKVIEIQKSPASLNTACLNSATCLSGIGRSAGGDHVVTGSLRMSSEQVLIELVYYSVSRGRFVRRLSFELPNDSEVIADNMDDMVRELLTGEAPKKEAAADAALADDFDLDDEDDEIDFDEEDFSVAAAEEDRRRAEAAAADRRAADARRAREAEEADRRRREAEAAERRRREAEAAEQRRREAEAAERRRREAEAEEERRREAAAAERRRREQAAADRRAEEAAAARRAEPEPEDEDEFDPNAFTFGGGFGGGDIIVEDDGARDEPKELPREEPVRTARRSEPTDYFDDLDEPDERDEPGGIVDLDSDDDEPVRRTRDPKPERIKTDRPDRKPTTSGSSGWNNDSTSVQVALRGGFSPYYALGFITTGGEASIALGDSGVHILGGVEAWTVSRDIPERFQAQAQATKEWNFLVPVNVGASYKLSLADGRVRPYFGADIVIARYYVPEGSSGRFSVGPRARAGTDLMVVRNFGFNVNVAMGFWSGKDWVIIEKDVQNSGLLPQISAGTVLAF